MHALVHEPERVPVDDGSPKLRTLLLTDLVGSTELVEKLGDVAGSALFREHDRAVLELQQRWRGRLIDRSDGLLLLFERPIDGLGFALDYVRALRELGQARGLPLQARAGLHVGEVVTWNNSDAAMEAGAKSLEVEGLAKPLAARLMQLARPGQILLSAVAEPLAHRAARELGERGERLLWKSYGRWRFKGVPQAQEIHEVGEVGIAPLRMPRGDGKAWRDIPLWRRPAALALELLLVAGLGVGAWLTTRPQPAIAFAQRDWVVVGDLRNLTRQGVLDDSLEQAFRISLEQSRHVNLLSDLKMRDTLARMRRDPQGTAIDRAVASEIALRDGARAVILPTVAEVGGRVRVTVEVVDPATRDTVYSESADGQGIGSVLASIDKVTADLRGELGETLESIRKDSKPLPEVTTGSIDALRAYALGLEALAAQEFPEALRYFQQAIGIDPEFALAYLGALRVHVITVDSDGARPYLAKAIALRDRLAPRDALYLDAWVAEFDPTLRVEAPQRWKLLAELYPDYYAGHHNYAWAMFQVNDYAAALEYARRAASPQNPLREAAYDLIGRIYLAEEQYDEALRNMVAAEQGGYGRNRRIVDALAASGRLDEAQARLRQLPEEGRTGADITNQFERVSLSIDLGQWQQASDAAAHAVAMARGKSPLLENEFRIIEHEVQMLRAPAEVGLPELDRVLRISLDAAHDIRNRDRDVHLFMALAAAYVAQRCGDTTVARDALPQLEKLVEETKDATSRQMLQVVKAGQLRLAGKPGAAAAMLNPLIDGRELFQVRVALRDALAAAGLVDEVKAENERIASSRGKAYIENAGDQVLQAVNVADTRAAASRTVAVTAR
jgi:putative peptide modification system cyclase